MPIVVVHRRKPNNPAFHLLLSHQARLNNCQHGQGRASSTSSRPLLRAQARVDRRGIAFSGQVARGNSARQTIHLPTVSWDNGGAFRASVTSEMVLSAHSRQVNSLIHVRGLMGQVTWYRNSKVSAYHFRSQVARNNQVCPSHVQLFRLRARKVRERKF